MNDVRESCVRCGGIVDPRGVSNNGTVYCDCVCRVPGRLPGEGCGARIFFRVNANERQQPFNLDDGRPHHPVCPAYQRARNESRTCPNCGGVRPRDRDCLHCGWRPPGDRSSPPREPRDRKPPGVGRLEDFDETGRER